jgi:hypothetical protein
MKSMTFDNLVEKVDEREKSFGKKSTQSTGETKARDLIFIIPVAQGMGHMKQRMQNPIQT